MATAVPTDILKEFDEEERALDVFRTEAQILVKSAHLLVIQINVEEFSCLIRLRDTVDETQARHRFVGEFRVNAYHLRMFQRFNEVEHVSGRRQVDVAARFVRLRL